MSGAFLPETGLLEGFENILGLNICLIIAIFKALKN